MFAHEIKSIEGVNKMRQCKKLVDEYKKYKRPYIKSQIRKCEKIKNPNLLEQYQLCQNYQSLCHTEFVESEIYDLCKNCKYNVNEEASKAMRDPNYKYEIIWGNVYLKEKFK